MTYLFMESSFLMSDLSNLVLFFKKLVKKYFGGFFKIFWEIFMLLIYTMTIFPNVHYINTTIFCSYTLSQYFLMSTLYVTICYSYTLSQFFLMSTIFITIGY